MNRTVWIARVTAAVILLAFLLLMSNLYVKLKRIESSGPPAATSR
jgi:hypothetical protein